jgi:hypothetical protein
MILGLFMYEGRNHRSVQQLAQCYHKNALKKFAKLA